MGLFGKPHRHDNGIQNCWCSLTEGITKSLVKRPKVISKRPSSPPPPLKIQEKPTHIFYRLWIEYKNGQNWCVERDTKEEVLVSINDDEVKHYEIMRFCGNKITKEELCAL